MELIGTRKSRNQLFYSENRWGPYLLLAITENFSDRSLLWVGTEKIQVQSDKPFNFHFCFGFMYFRYHGERQNVVIQSIDAQSWTSVSCWGARVFNRIRLWTFTRKKAGMNETHQTSVTTQSKSFLLFFYITQFSLSAVVMYLCGFVKYDNLEITADYLQKLRHRLLW